MKLRLLDSVLLFTLQVLCVRRCSMLMLMLHSRSGRAPPLKLQHSVGRDSNRAGSAGTVERLRASELLYDA